MGIRAGVMRRRRNGRIICLVIAFSVIVLIGFVLNLTTYESLRLSNIELAIVNLPEKLKLYPNSEFKLTTDIFQNVSYSKHGNYSAPSEIQPLWKQPTLLDLNFKWIMNNVNICRIDSVQGNPKLMPILVHTARSHFDERSVLRKSLGSVPVYKNWIWRMIFLLGETDGTLSENERQREEEKMNDEQMEHADLVVGNFVDTYRNLTYKHLMGYKWILNFCQNADLILKIDDDIFVDIFKWLDWRTADLNKKFGKVPDLYCNTFRAKPFRERNSKWFISETEWPDEYYPDYCSGWAYAINFSLIEKIYTVADTVKFFWIDDVFVTGVLLEKAKIVYNFKPSITHIWGQVGSDVEQYRDMCGREAWDEPRHFRTVTDVSRGKDFERDMMCLWKKTLHDIAPSHFEIYYNDAAVGLTCCFEIYLLLICLYVLS